MRIWIDFDNSPHVLFFEPIVKKLTALGHDVVLSARDHAQTLALCEQKGLKAERIGSHGGSTSLGKLASLATRSWRCRAFARRRRPNLALSHGSRSLTLAAWSLRIPVVTIYDYEKASYGLFNALSRRILAPSLIPPRALQEIGLDLRKLRQYPGVKEEVYLAGSVASHDYRVSFGIAEHEVLLVLRPPATSAHYHVRRTDTMYEATVRHLSRQKNLVVVLLTRTRDQIQQARSLLEPGRVRLIVPDGVVDGPGLLMQADLVISAGGTMNREAAVLGTPVYSVFCGALGAIDRHFIDSGRTIQITQESELPRIIIRRRPQAGVAVPPNPELIAGICAEILAAA